MMETRVNKRVWLQCEDVKKELYTQKKAEVYQELNEFKFVSFHDESPQQQPHRKRSEGGKGGGT